MIYLSHFQRDSLGPLFHKSPQNIFGSYLLCPSLIDRGVWELKREGALHPILSLTKFTVRQNCLSSCLPMSSYWTFCLPLCPLVILPFGLSCLSIFFQYSLYPSFFSSFFLLDRPDPPSRTPLGERCQTVRRFLILRGDR